MVTGPCGGQLQEKVYIPGVKIFPNCYFVEHVTPRGPGGIEHGPSRLEVCVITPRIRDTGFNYR